MTFDGRIEAQIVVPSGQFVTVTTNAGGPIAVTIIAGGYYPTAFCAHLSAQMSSQAPVTGGTWSVTLDAATGRVTIAVSAGTCTFAAPFGMATDPLSDLLGFASAISGVASAVGASQMRGLWIPDRPIVVADSDPRMAPVYTDLRQTRSPHGKVIGIGGGNAYHSHRRVFWEHVEKARVWEYSVSLARASWETFVADTQLGRGHTWFRPTSPVQIYDTGNVKVGIAANAGAGVSGWYMEGVTSVDPKRSIDHWTGAYTIEIPRLVAETGASAGASTFHVALVGQSNTVGQMDTDKADTGLSIATIYPAAQINQQLGAAAADPISWTSYSTRALQPYGAGGGPGAGIELSLGRYLVEYGVHTSPAISKFAVNGSSLAANWLPSANYPTSPPGVANLYTQLVTYLTARVAEFGKLDVLEWGQGEADAAVTAHANAYAANLTTLMTALRAIFGGFHLVLWKLNDACTPGGDNQLATLRAQQVAYAASDPNCTLLDADDLPLNTDGLHYKADELITVGNRSGELIARRYKPTSSGANYNVGTGSAPWLQAKHEPGAFGAGALTPRWPIHKAGDIAILAVATAPLDAAISLTTSNGFTQIESTQSSLGAGVYQKLALYWCRADQATMDANGGQMPAPVVADTNNMLAARIFVFRGCVASGSPVDVASGSSNNTYDTPVSIAGDTTTVGNALVAAFLSCFSGSSVNTVGSWANSTLAGLVERQDSRYLIVADTEMLALVTGTKTTAGAYNATTATTATATVQAGMTIALKGT